MKKRLLNIIFISILLISIIPLSNASEVMAKEKDDMTIGELEAILLDHLVENKLNIEIGTPEYRDYLLGVLMYDNDSKLKSNPYYLQVRGYAAEYIYQLEKNGIKESDERKKFNIENIKYKTINQIKDEIKKEELKIINDSKKIKGSNQNATILSYNATAAINYANQWWDGRNSLYNNYSEDCTNFASQVVLAGGKLKTRPSSVPTGIYDTTYYWYSCQ